MLNRSIQGLMLISALAFLSACSGGGTLSLEPGAKKVTSKGAPNVTVNQGGKALIVEQGQTATTGVHGYVTIQAVTARNMASVQSGGATAVLNSSQAQANR